MTEAKKRGIRKKALEAKKNGKCINCFTRMAVEGRVRCGYCLMKDREYRRDRRDGH